MQGGCRVVALRKEHLSVHGRSSAVSWRCVDRADCLPQAEVTLYLVSSAALGGYLTSAALFVLSGAPASSSLCSYWVACTMQYNCQRC